MSLEDEMIVHAREFLESIRQRHTVRSFDPRPVPLEVINYCISAAGTAPSGANHQPWHFVVVGDPAIKSRIRVAAEEEERNFYAGRAGEVWLSDLKPLGTDANKSFLETAPWLIAVFAEKSGSRAGSPKKNYYVPESVGIATGFLIAALHNAGLATLVHYILLVVGHPAQDAMIPEYATIKKPLSEIASFR
jgi:iodotyrosine deiodinase